MRDRLHVTEVSLHKLLDGQLSVILKAPLLG